MKTRVLALALVALVVAAALVAPARVAHAADPRYHDDEARFSVDLPPGWRLMPNDRLDAIRSSVGIPYSAGFEPEARAANAYPYVVVRFAPTLRPYASWEEALAAVGKVTSERADEARRASALGAHVVGLEVGAPVPERGKNRVVVRTRMEMKDRVVSGYTVGMIGKNGIVYLGATSRADDAARGQPDVDALFASFRWDAGLEWDVRERSLFDWILPPSIVLAIFLAGVALTRRGLSR